MWLVVGTSPKEKNYPCIIPAGLRGSTGDLKMTLQGPSYQQEVIINYNY